MSFFKQLFCQHDFAFARNIHGDEIIAWGWKRSIWQCQKCGKVQARDLLIKEGGQE